MASYLPYLHFSNFSPFSYCSRPVAPKGMVRWGIGSTNTFMSPLIHSLDRGAVPMSYSQKLLWFFFLFHPKFWVFFFLSGFHNRNVIPFTNKIKSVYKRTKRLTRPYDKGTSNFRSPTLTSLSPFTSLLAHLLYGSPNCNYQIEYYFIPQAVPLNSLQGYFKDLIILCFHFCSYVGVTAERQKWFRPLVLQDINSTFNSLVNPCALPG